MYFREFTLTQGDVLKVKKALNRIRLLYPQICIRFEKTNSESKSKILWITVNGPTERICEDAKKYMIAMTKNDTIDTILIPEAVQKELLLNNCKILRDIETQNTVVIDLDVIKHHVSIQGDELEVTLAKSLIYEQIEKFQKLSRNGNVDYLADQMKEVTIDNNIKNFALKLGYNESTIKLAANNCIENRIELNEDTLLKELTKQCPQNIPNNNSSNPEIQEEDFVAKTVAQYTSEQLTMDNNDLRGIVIDGSNVAMCHGHKQIFSCAGIEIVVNWFKQRGHRNIKVFVPQWRQEAPKADCPIKNQEILGKLEKEKFLVFTPSRRINGRRVVCYDDRYIVKYAVETDSIIVSNDNFRDLQKENPKWKQYLDLHILMYSFVNDMFMPPYDPLGRSGPNLDEFLRAGPYQAKICPYRNKCTYGSKCRYFHPESNIDTNDKAPNFLRSTINSEHEPVSRYSSINNRSGVLAQPFSMSCAAEMKAYEQQQQYQLYENDVIARGGAVMSDDFSTNSDQHRSMREWQQRQPQPQAYPSMNYYQAQPYQQYHAQRQTSIQPQSQQFYTLPTSTQPTQWTTSPQPSHYQPQPQPQSYTLQPRSTPPPSNQYYMPVHHSNNNSYHHPNAHLSLMNGGYVDPRSMNNGYYQQPVTSHTLQVIEPRKREMVERATFERRSQIEGSPLFQNLIELFPDYSAIVRKVLTEHPNERDMNILVSHVLNEQNR